MVTFEKIGSPKGSQARPGEVWPLAQAMLAEPEAWFTVNSVAGGDRAAVLAVVSALDEAVAPDGHKVKLWEPHGRGFYCVTLAVKDKPYAHEHA